MTRYVGLGLCCLAFVLGGCGGDDDEASDAPTREEFIAAGDELCREVNDKIASANERLQEIEQSATDQQQALADAAPVLAETYDFQRAQLGEFRDLTPPEGDAVTFDKIVAGLEQQVALVGQLADAAEAGDAERLTEVGSQVAGTRSRVRGLFQGYGFEECGSG
jgi:hypothetical protein